MSSPERFNAAERRASLDNVKAAGLAAYTHAAIVQGAPVRPLLNAYAGNMYVSGFVAPPSWFTTVTREAMSKELWAITLDSNRKAAEAEQDAAYMRVYGPMKSSFDDAVEAEDDDFTAETELTLVDATVLPAIAAQGTKSGGQRLPVIRVPLASIDLWWFADGEVIKGSSGWSGSFGVLFPVDF